MCEFRENREINGQHLPKDWNLKHTRKNTDATLSLPPAPPPSLLAFFHVYQHGVHRREGPVIAHEGAKLLRGEPGDQQDARAPLQEAAPKGDFGEGGQKPPLLARHHHHGAPGGHRELRER